MYLLCGQCVVDSMCKSLVKLSSLYLDSYLIPLSFFKNFSVELNSAPMKLFRFHFLWMRPHPMQWTMNNPKYPIIYTHWTWSWHVSERFQVPWTCSCKVYTFQTHPNIVPLAPDFYPMKTRTLEWAAKIGDQEHEIRQTCSFQKQGWTCLELCFKSSQLEFLNYIQPNFRPDFRDVRWVWICKQGQAALVVRWSRMQRPEKRYCLIERTSSLYGSWWQFMKWCIPELYLFLLCWFGG